MEQDEGAGAGAARCLPPCAEVEGWTKWDIGNGSLSFLAAALPAFGLALACKTLLILLLFRDFSGLDAAWVLPSTISVGKMRWSHGGTLSCEQ